MSGNVITLFAPPTPDIVFAEDYRALVLPAVLTLVPVSGVLIVLGHQTYADEFDTIVRVAWHLGGAFLRDDLWPFAEEWVADRLTEAIDSIEVELQQHEQNIRCGELQHVG